LFRTVTSDVLAVSGFVANSTSPCNTFLPPSLELRTSGFPQYGFKLEFNHMQAYSQFPSPDLHRLDTRPYGLRTNDTNRAIGANLADYTNARIEVMGRLG